MRALCGAIITAGALIALGLTTLGIGTRYQNYAKFSDFEAYRNDPKANPDPRIHMTDMDRSLLYPLVLSGMLAVIGLAATFVGLAYHHQRRHHEMLHAGHPPHPSQPAPTAFAPSPPTT
jgi:hypothetical protein